MHPGPKARPPRWAVCTIESAVLRILTRQDDVLGRAAPRFSPNSRQASSGSETRRTRWRKRRRRAVTRAAVAVVNSVFSENFSIKSSQVTVSPAKYSHEYCRAVGGWQKSRINCSQFCWGFGFGFRNESVLVNHSQIHDCASKVQSVSMSPV